MTENEINRIALQQLAEYEESEGDYEERLFNSRDMHGNHARTVDNVSKKVARAAFGSSEPSSSSKRYYSEDNPSISDWFKAVLKKPGVKDGIIIGSVLVLKFGLFYAYRHASKEGLQIAEL